MSPIIIQEIAHHRNGCTGEPFHAVRFTDDGAPMLGLVFAEHGNVAVIDARKALETVAFGENSYRGDQYERLLRDAIEYQRQLESIRAGAGSAPRHRGRSGQCARLTSWPDRKGQ